MVEFAHLEAIAVVALSALGARYCLLSGQILGMIGKAVEKLPTAARKPLGTCERCMVSTWGVASLLIVTFGTFWMCVPVYLLAAIGLQEMFDR